MIPRYAKPASRSVYGMSRLLDLLLPALIGALVMYVVSPSEPVSYPEVIVPAARIIEREPDTVRTFIDRVIYRTIPPVQAATAPAAAQDDVARFCAPTVAMVSDTLSPPPMLLLRSVAHSPGWFWQRDKLFLSGPTSYGDLNAYDYRVRPGFSVRAIGDSLLVQYPRTSLFREILEVAIPFGIGYAVGR